VVAFLDPCVVRAGGTGAWGCQKSACAGDLGTQERAGGPSGSRIVPSALSDLRPVTDPAAEVWAITGTGADYAIEASGRAEALRQAVDCLGLLGICGLIGGPPAGAEVTLDMNRILFGRTVRGILGGDSIPDLFIPHLIELYLRGRFPFDRLITFYPLREINQAADDFLAGRAVKPVLRP
jgi:Zn-dependent alcohol dehydrogenase